MAQPEALVVDKSMDKNMDKGVDKCTSQLSGAGSVVKANFRACEEQEYYSGSDLEEDLQAVKDRAVAGKTKAAAEIERRLLKWSASSSSNLSAIEAEREYKFPAGPPNWKCVVCKRAIPSDPVFQCQTGHLACSSCANVGTNCRTCSKAVSRIKNVAVENMMDSLVVTCKFAKLGCKKVTRFTELKHSDHEAHCRFSPMVCPMPGCNQAGLKYLFSQHLRTQHKISQVVNVGKSGHPYFSKEFEVDASTSLVLLRLLNQWPRAANKEFHLLHHESTALGDRLQISSLRESQKRKYGLNVKTSEELTYSFKSVSTSSKQPEGGLLIPTQPDGRPQKSKRCRLYMPR